MRSWSAVSRGSGKSALLAAVSAQAAGRGVQVLSAVGVQSEANLPFAGLHEMIRPVLRLAAGLPDRQRAALHAAFGMANAEAGELFLIGLATLELISDTAEGAPVLLIVDDAHWLDQASCAVLAFVARRLAAEPAVMLAAVRDGQDSVFDCSGLPELRLAELGEDAAAALLDARAPGLEPDLRARLLAEAAGNPLALVKPAAARWPRTPGAGAYLSSPLPVTARLEEAFAARESDLPAATRSALLAAAADDRGVLGEALKAAAILEGRQVTVERVRPGGGGPAGRHRWDEPAVPAPCGAVGDLSSGGYIPAPGGARRAGRGASRAARPPGMASGRSGFGSGRTGGSRAGRRGAARGRPGRGGGGGRHAGAGRAAQRGRRCPGRQAVAGGRACFPRQPSRARTCAAADGRGA